MNFHFNWDYLKKPWIILSGVVVGALIGLFCPALGIKLAPLGNAYISLLSMCVIPIMVTAIITSISRMFHSVEAGFYIKRIAAVFLLGLFITSALGLSLAVIVKPGMNMSQDKMVKIGQALIKGESETVSTNAGSTGFDMNTLLKMLIPENIFKALSNGMNLQILFFSIIFGISTGFLPRPKSELIIDISDAVFKAFEKAIFLIMYLLPFGLICMLSGQFATAGLDILLAMIKFVLLVYLVGLILVLLASLLICLKTKKNILQVIKDLQDPLVISLGTSNTYATMPSVFQALHDNFHLPSQLTNLIVPLSIV
ncbi:MAG: cation:dicarboxylase symporter family transporter, partial [Syntrophomonas sp.]